MARILAENPNPAFRQVIHSAGVRRFGEAHVRKAKPGIAQREEAHAEQRVVPLAERIDLRIEDSDWVRLEILTRNGDAWLD
jgi:hypothetical protein